jgi:dephospho-CoA kinase
VETCIERIVLRNGWTPQEALARLKAQLAIEDKIRQGHWLVDNSGPLEDLDEEVDKLIQDIGRKFP